MTIIKSQDTQLDEWVKGTPIHNIEREECTPDFSCCRGSEFMADEDVRKRFTQAYYDNDETVIHEMLMMFLGKALEGENVYIAGEMDVRGKVI